MLSNKPSELNLSICINPIRLLSLTTYRLSLESVITDLAYIGPCGDVDDIDLAHCITPPLLYLAI